jgi:hypothetical protein
MLKIDVCRKCMEKRIGIGSEEGVIKCYPALSFDEEEKFEILFSAEWGRGKVWCYGVADLPTAQSPVSSEGVFDPFAKVDGNIPGGCLFKEDQLGSDIWKRVSGAIAIESSSTSQKESR